MERFHFFLGLHFGGQLHSHTDNLSKDLQGAKVAACCQWTRPGIGIGIGIGIGEDHKNASDQSFDHFYANISRKSEGLLGKRTLPRKRCTSARLEVGASTPSYPQTAKDYFRRVSYEAIDIIVSAIYQESFSSCAQMDTLLMKAANGDDYEAEFKFLEASYREDIDTGALPGHATKYFGSYVIGEDSMF